MEQEQLNVVLIAILSSSVLAAIVSALVSTYLKKKDYEHEYFKEVIQRRLETYRFIETQIAVLKSSVYDDGEMYHLIFAYGYDKFNEFQQSMFVAVSSGIWVSEDTKDALIELNRLFVNMEHEFDMEVDSVAAGKKYHKKIATLRDTIEASYRADMLELHKVRKFLKQKAKSVNMFLPTNEVFRSPSATNKEDA